VHPILFRIPLPGGGYFDIASYGVMLALGTLAGVFAAMRLTRREGLSTDTVIDLGFWAVIAGVLGAKTWFIVQFWGSVQDKMDLFRNFRSGLVFYGGIVGAAIVVAWFARFRKLPVAQMLDVAGPCAMLGLAFGRIGCFLNGCCWGKATTAWYGVRFGQVFEDNRLIGSLPYFDQIDKHLITDADKLTLPVIPTQLIESASVLAVFVILVLMRRTRKFFGEQVSLMLVLYGMVRFTVEFFRGDNSPVLAGLSPAQVFSVCMFIVGLCGLAYLRTARPESLLVANAAKARAGQTKPSKVKGK
jgi:phosphatidylglycerol:prolipoprotein diacylglycerol transferase